jgi:hypothetical protein
MPREPTPGGPLAVAIPKRSRLEMAREVAADLLDELETGAAPVSQTLMRAKRLARLLRDEDAQTWLTLETNGYPDDYDFARLGSCRRYAVEGGRLTGEGKYYPQSLPRIESEVRASESALPIPSSGPPLKVDDYVQAGATAQVLRGVEQQAENARIRYSNWSSLNASMRAAIHAYATDASLALELGDAAESIFESARRDVDVFVRAHAPRAGQHLLAISERMRESDGESLSSAMGSCRRLLSAVADAVFPPRAEEYVDRGGIKRKVGPEEYKNRLLAFVEQSLGSDGTRAILSTDLEHLAARLDALYEKACKGIHAGVTIEEARLAVISTYIFLAEIARAAALPAPQTEADDTAPGGSAGSKRERADRVAGSHGRGAPREPEAKVTPDSVGSVEDSSSTTGQSVGRSSREKPEHSTRLTRTSSLGVMRIHTIVVMGILARRGTWTPRPSRTG